MIASELAKLGHGGDRSKAPIGGLTQEQAAEQMQAKERAIQVHGARTDIAQPCAMSQDRAAEALNVSRRTAQTAKVPEFRHLP